MAADTCLIEKFIESDELTISQQRNRDFLMQSLSSWFAFVDEFKVGEVCDGEIVAVFDQSWVSRVSGPLKQSVKIV